MIRALPIAALVVAAPVAAAPVETCDARPVYMVVAGPTHDRARMMAYARAIADSGLYARLGGYYVNVPRPVAVFEGTPPANWSTLIVRFPCLANARAFWNSRVYQQAIKPLRLNPAAGDYSVTVYPEAELPAHMAGKVEGGGYTAPFSAAGVEQLAPEN
jgi:uncharacterized protein (DUF1330 family)